MERPSWYLPERDWPLEVWRKRYLEHPLLGTLARRLIWVIESGQKSQSAIFVGGVPIDVAGKAVKMPKDRARISLWHPLNASAKQVEQWRDFLVERSVSQPFKQAHREVYVVTDAEKRTGTYSNRFAAHFIRQHQFQVLCQQKGWVYSLMGNFDSYSIPERVIPGTNWRAEFHVETAAESPLSNAGIYLYLSTDQVRFYEGMEQRKIAEVPPLYFSECMRDVDMFVSVCSIGNDPEWRNRTDTRAAPVVRHAIGGQQLDRYWTAAAFGELSEASKTRKNVISQLLPKLRIGSQCSIHDRFLHVKGKLRSYKIHLGSGNILMNPNDRYLCIVASHNEDAGAAFLPFEGDNLLSMILSKAFMLVDDDKIRDKSIASQIRIK